MTRPSLGKRAALACGSLALALALLDVAVARLALDDGLIAGRPVPPYRAITHPRQTAWLAGVCAEGESGRSSGAGSFDAELGWTVAPNRRSARENSNAIGARGLREYAPARPAGALRIVSYGDSFTYGAEVADEHTWQAQLERREPAVEAINLGVGGYGTDQALLRFRRHGRLDADVVAIGILLENIGRNVNRYRPLWYPRASAASTKPRFRLAGDGRLVLVPAPVASAAELCSAVQDGTILERLAPHEYWLERPGSGAWRHSGLARCAAALAAARERSPRALWQDEDGEPRRVTLAILQSFRAEALASGAARALVLLFPRETDLAGLASGAPRYWQSGLDQLGAAGVEVLDLSAALVEALRSEPARAAELYEGGHLGPLGNALVAAELAEWLAEQGLLREAGLAR